MGGQPEGFSGLILAHAGDLEENPARLDNSHPVIHVTLARTHAGFGGPLGHRLVGEDANPQLATAAHVTHDGATSGLDLPAGHPLGLCGLQAVDAEIDGVAPTRLALHAPAVHLPKLHTFWH